MRIAARIRSAWRSLFRQADVERELDDELRFAVDELTRRHLARGLTLDAATRQARADLGRLDIIKEDVRAQGLAHALETLCRDTVYGWKSLARTRAFSLLVIAILAVGIGAATAIFSVVNALLLEPLPYKDADRLVFVWQDLTRAGYPRAPLAGPELQDLRDRATVFSGFAGIWANTIALTDGTEPEQLRIGLVTPDFFDVLGADAQLGRTFERRDDGETAAPGILLSHAVWKRRYGADPSLVGKRILANGRPTTVIGVMPESFRLLLPPDSAIPDDQQAWLLLGRNSLRWPRQQQFLRVVGRMKPGVALADAQKEIAAISRRIGKEFTEYGSDGATFYAVGLQDDATREVRPALLALFAAVTLLLTIGCVNVAGLLITRAANRQHETAVRLAMGAGRARLFRQCLVEGLLLSCAGGVLGIVVAQLMLDLLLTLRPASLGRIDRTQIDVGVFMFTAGASVIWGVLFSFAPFAQVFRTNVTGVLHGAGRTAVGTSGQRARTALVVSQVAISCVLLVSAALVAKSFHELQHVNAGFDESGVLTFKVSLGGPRYRTPDAVAAFSRQLRERLAAIPRVSGTGAISHVPYDTVPNWGTPYLPEQVSDITLAGVADARAVTPGYFEATGAQLLEGRWFVEADSAAAQPVAIVDSLLAARMWPGESAIGRRLKADPGTTGFPAVTLTIVGVLRHIRHRDITRDLREQMYFPAQQSLRNPMAYVIRSGGDPAQLAESVRRALGEIDKSIPVYDVRPLASYTREARAVRAFTLLLAVAFAASALVLAGVGVYGVTAYAAAGRRREFALRFALGASVEQVATLVFRDAISLAAAGGVVGCIGAAGAARVLRTQLYNVSALDPVAYAIGIVVIVCASIVAAAIPAYRASRTSPLESLHNE
jgi:predicted permease